ncbi:MAG: NYN domain-containing protein [Anaerolineaceae bacterium]|nr:NYN domain-containing protein [Anaerolineaceae bacterium]
MLLLIDGHNLIPKIPGINLSDPNDEDELIRLLQQFCRLRRRSVEVYFDRAPVGRAGAQQLGSVRAVFVREGVTADEAIMDRLRALGKRARNVQVVSSDRQVQQAARGAHAVVITSEAFAQDIDQLMTEEPEIDPRNRLLTDDELSEWEALFRKGHRGQDRRD